MEKNYILGMYLSKKSGKNFNFKEIKQDNYYKNILFSHKNDFYLISDKKTEIEKLVMEMSMSKPENFPDKIAKKYTHMRYIKANQKKINEFIYLNVKYYIVLL